MALAPCGISGLARGRIEPRLSEGRMKPSPMRPTMAKATSSHSVLLRSSSSISAKEAASSASPMLTSSQVGCRSASRPTPAMVKASTMPAGSMMVPTCEAERCRATCMYTGSR